LGKLDFGQTLLLKGASAEEKPPTQAPGHLRAAKPPPPSTRASRTRVRELQSRIVSTPPSRSTFVKGSLLPTTRDARRGIILMTVLDPVAVWNRRTRLGEGLGKKEILFGAGFFALAGKMCE
jgi:hypothetical protein